MFGRTYQFDFVPKVRTQGLVPQFTITRTVNLQSPWLEHPQGFMGRLMIRLLGFPLAAQVIWRYGMLARIAKYILHFSFI